MKISNSTQGIFTGEFAVSLALRKGKSIVAYLLVIWVSIIFCCCSDDKESKSGLGFEIQRTSDSCYIHIRQSDSEQIEQVFAFHKDSIFSRIVTTSVTQVGFLQAIGAETHIAGVCDSEYLYTGLPGAVDVGSSLTLDYEKIINTKADLVLLTYNGDSRFDTRLSDFGIPTLMINEWREQNPLSRAEWVKVFGALTGKEYVADSVFLSVTKAYNKAKTHRSESEKVSIMSGSAWQGTWYVPDGNTYMAQLFRDAGANYIYREGKGASIPLSFEEALLKFKDADVWVGAPVETLQQLRDRDEKNTWFKAYQSGRVYSFNKRTNGAANDFWQMGVAHPEYILQDLVHILNNDSDSLMFFSQKLR